MDDEIKYSAEKGIPRTGTGPAALKLRVLVLREENIRCKNRISEVLQGKNSHILLEKLELFQNGLIKQDFITALARNDIAELEKLTGHVTGNGTYISDRLQKLSETIAAAEDNFRAFTNSFDEWIQKNVS